MCPRFPYPLEKGDKLRMYHQLKHLAERHEVYLITLSKNAIDQKYLSKLQGIVKEVLVYQLSSKSRIFSLWKATFSRLPFQVAYYYNRSIHKRIAKKVALINPDHIYCQLTRMAEYAKDLPFPKTLDYMDAFGVGMERRAETVRGFLSFIYHHEAGRMKQYESDIYKSFDHHTVISEQDNQHITDQLIHVIPNGIDTHYFQSDEKGSFKYDIGFVGNMGYAPNIDAVEYLVNDILPSLSSEVTTIIAGARPDRRVQKLASGKIEVSGWVDDIRSAYNSIRLFVAPLWQGTGQQNKILEAMAMGVPCVTTSSVNNAIGGVHEKSILVADSQEEFVSAIERLLKDQSLYDKIRGNALTFVRENHSWEESVRKLETIFRSDIKKKY